MIRWKFASMTPLEIARFWSKVDIPVKTRYESHCWMWRGKHNIHGYAQHSIRSRMPGAKRHNTGGHRVAYELIVGPIPEGFVLDHLCRNRGCVNPYHMEVVTTQINVRRGIGLAAENHKKTECLRGHALSGDNLFVDRQGHRNCRACARDKRRRLYAGLGKPPRWSDEHKAAVAARRYSSEVRGSVTTCSRGHELIGENPYVSPRGYKQCMECRRQSLRRHLAAKKATGVTP